MGGDTAPRLDTDSLEKPSEVERKPERVGAVDPLIVGRPALVSVSVDDLLAPGGAG